MQFILVNGRSLARSLSARCAASPSRTVYVREIATRLSDCSIKFYVDHCIDTTRAFENHARAS
jgi:hypothetical protein